ncbi:MAG: LysR family transcriptional regulator [Geobacter sp.]|nr:LysR family transcriptional regulator [Geobacter sp.]
MNLDKLKIFHTVATTLNFTRAAENLHLTQPGISKHVRALEDQYGTPLFDRLGKRVVLTQAGEILYKATASAFTLLDEAKSRIDDLQTFTGGRLAIGGSITIATYLLPKILMQFRKAAPGVELAVETAFSRKIVDKVLDNSLELGFVGHCHPDASLKIHLFMKERMVLVAPPDHPWVLEERKVSLKEMAGEMFLLSKQGSGTWQFVSNITSQADVTLENIMELGSSEGVKQGVLAGLGVAILARHVVAGELAGDMLREVPLQCGSMERDLYLVHHKDRYLSRAAQLFMSLCGLKNLI